MVETFASLASPLAVTAVTYLLHSTLLFLLARFFLIVVRSESNALHEQVWKAAALAGLITTPVHLCSAFASPSYRLQLSRTERAAAQEARVVSKKKGSPSNQRSNQSPTAVHRKTLPIETHADSTRPPIRPELTHKREIAALEAAPRPVVRTSPPFPVELDALSIAAQPPSGERVESKPVFPSAVRSANQNSKSPPAVAGRNARKQAGIDTNRPAEAKRDIALTVTRGPERAPVTRIVGSWIARHFSRQPLQQLVMAAVAVLTLAVALAAVCRLVWQTWSFSRRVARFTPLNNGKARKLLDELRASASINRKVDLLLSATYSQPVAFGIFRWRIVLPEGLERVLAPDELKALFAHELAHLVRGDAWWLWIGHVICSLFAFQPMNFYARKAWRRAAEFQCDDWAIQQSVPPLALARCLTHVAERSRRHRACATALAAVGTKAALTARVERLVQIVDRNDPWAHGRRRLLVTFAILFVMAGLALWGPRATLHAQAEATDKRGVNASDSRIAPARSIVRPQIAQGDTAATAVVIDPNSSETLDVEIDRLQQELKQLVDETNELLDEPKSSPTLQPVWERIRGRIEVLEQRIEQLAKLRRSVATQGEAAKPVGSKQNTRSH